MQRQIVWLSLDPVRCRIDFYPAHAAKQIEEAYSCKQDAVAIVDFFNATVHFGTESEHYQTTPGQHFDRSGFKQPGYRTVARLVKKLDQNDVTLFGRRVCGEWRMCDQDDSERNFRVTIPADCTVPAFTHTAQVWTLTDCTRLPETDMIVWQWCQNISNNIGELTDNDWSPCAPNSACIDSPSPISSLVPDVLAGMHRP